MERKDAVQYENALEPSIIRCYIDGSKLNERAGASFYIEYVELSISRCYADGSKLNERAGASFYTEYASGFETDQKFFHLGKYSTVFRAEVFAIAEVAKKLIVDRIVNEKIIILVDSQAANLAIQNNILKSNAVLTCIKNLNILGKDNDVTIAWTPGHTGIQGNGKAEILAKSGSALNCSGPEPFISIPYASCRAAIKDWTVKRWKTLLENKTKCRVGFAPFNSTTFEAQKT